MYHMHTFGSTYCMHVVHSVGFRAALVLGRHTLYAIHCIHIIVAKPDFVFPYTPVYTDAQIRGAESVIWQPKIHPQRLQKPIESSNTVVRSVFHKHPSLHSHLGAWLEKIWTPICAIRLPHTNMFRHSTLFSEKNHSQSDMCPRRP